MTRFVAPTRRLRRLRDRLGRGAALALALLTLAQPALARHDEAAHAHTLCAEHGETVHAHHSGETAASRPAHAAWNVPAPAPAVDSQCAWPAAPVPAGRGPDTSLSSGCALTPPAKNDAPPPRAPASGAGPAVYRYAPKLSPPSV